MTGRRTSLASRQVVDLEKPWTSAALVRAFGSFSHSSAGTGVILQVPGGAS